jgi:hypothetical protein
MRHPIGILIRLLFIAVAAGIAGCGSENVTVFENPNTPTNKPPVFVEALPADVTPDAWIGSTVEFSVSATDPDGDDLSYEFSVDDSVVTNSSRYSHSAVETGTCHVVATATDGRVTIDNEWWLSVADLPDSIAPAQVTILAVEPGAEPHEVEVRWSAVGDDGMVGRAALYVVATSSLPIENLSDWDSAEKHAVDGSAADPGSVMQLVARRTEAAGFTAVAVKAVDEQDNVSPLGPYASGYTRGYSYSGLVTDVFTDNPIAGVLVGDGGRSTTTESDGSWQLTEMPIVTSGLLISDEGVAGPLGSFFDYVIDDPNHDGAYYPIKLVPVIELESGHYADFMHFFIAMTEYIGQPNFPYNSYLRHWELPIDLYVPPFEIGGLNYEATIERVAVELAAHIGFTVFRVVDSPPAIGVHVSYLDPGSTHHDNFAIYEWTEDLYPITGDLKFRSTYEATDLAHFELVIRHELGHALGLAHSTDKKHLMLGGQQVPSVNNFTADELAALRIIYSIPRGYPVGAYLRD